MEERWKQDRVISTFGGLYIWLGITVLFFGAAICQTESWLTGCAFLVIGGTGYLDDWLKRRNKGVGLQVRDKLFGQASAALLLVLGTHWMGFEQIAYFALVLVIVNAVNIVDNMDGACGLISLVVLGFFYAHLGDPVILVFMGLVFVFLLFNFPKAKVMMGDCGSMTIGLFLAWCFLQGQQVQWTRNLWILGVPLADFVFVSVTRIMRKQKPWQGDTTHLTHRLSRKMDSDVWAVLVLTGCGVICGLVSMSVVG